jgi:hypothetical protein
MADLERAGSREYDQCEKRALGGPCIYRPVLRSLYFALNVINHDERTVLAHIEDKIDPEVIARKRSKKSGDSTSVALPRLRYAAD